MPQSTGNAPPPDGNGRTTHDDQVTQIGTRSIAGSPVNPASVADDAATLLPIPTANTPVPAAPARQSTSAAETGWGADSADASGKTASDNGPLQIGQPFGTRYHIERVLGVGGMGAVYQAWDSELGVRVALKVIRPEITASDPAAAGEIERRFKRELLLARQVTHPNIIRIHDLGDINGIKYITMPFIDGADLATILKQDKSLPIPRALRIARGTVAGLVSAHQAGVIHRDLKPANIMIGTDDTPTIMDFGIARSAGGPGHLAASPVLVRPADISATAAAAASSTMAGAIVGTVAYMAPEQARGDVADQRADIYAFGLILYDMLIGGRRAERAISAIAELQERMVSPPPPPRSIDPGIPDAVDAIVRRCLEPDAAKRFQTSLELQEALDRLDDNGKPLPIVRRLTRRTLVAAAIGVVLLVAGAFYTAQQLAAPPTEHAPVSVVIADFQNNTNDPTFDHTLAPTLRRGLESATFITAFDRAGVRTTFGVVPPDQFDETAARQLAIKEGLGVVLAGSIGMRGTGYEINVRAATPMTGEVITSVSRRASSKEQILPAVTQLVTSLRNALGDETSESAQQLAMKTISTTSLEVASYYAAAVHAQSSGDAEQALQSFAKTVELDPEFGLGYQGMAVMSRNLGRLQDSEKYAGEALRYLDKMTERERFATRGYYYIRTGDYQQCVKEYGDLIARYPADVPALNQRASCLARLRDINAAVEEMRKVVNILPNHHIYRSNLAVLLNYAGDFAGAENEIRAIAEPEARALGALALSQQGRGLIREAAATYEKIATMDAWGASYGPAGLGDLAVYEGRFADAVKIFEAGAGADLAAKKPDAAALKYASAAYAHLARGQKDRAVSAAETALTHSTSPPIRFLAARIFVQAGASNRAEKMAAAFTSQLAAAHQAYGKILEGGIALERGDARLAVKLLTEANEIHDTWFGHFDLGRAFLAASALPQADSEFDRCIQRRGEALTLVDEDPTFGQFPIVYYYQGRVREQLKTASYADSYRAYLEIRGTSTEDPLLPEIRKRLGN